MFLMMVGSVMIAGAIGGPLGALGAIVIWVGVFIIND